MRSYYAHLHQVSHKEKDTTEKPTFRSSAIFPVINAQEISTRLIFLSYWNLKRNIKEITQLTTLRDEDGKVLTRHLDPINENKAYRIELTDLLEASGRDPEKSFHGSIEVEFFSSSPLVYPYPAVSINFYGENYTTTVHTTQRVYNDFEDMTANSQQRVPEGGFNIYASETQEPFIGLVNGPIEEESCAVDFEFINADNETMPYELVLGRLAPYETRFIYPAREVDLAKFLKGKAGTLKADFSVKWIYPRLLVGNIQDDPKVLSITHSYYDCSAAKEDSDFWLEEEQGWHAAALMTPIKVSETSQTNICLYPIYSPGKFNIDLEVYNAKGKLLGQKEHAAKFDGQHNTFVTLSMDTLLEELDIEKGQDLALRVIANQAGKGKIPARIKISLNIGHQDNALPCNICTNLIPFNPEWENKVSTFHWMPLLADRSKGTAWILNSSPKRDFDEQADVVLTYYRESDGLTLEREKLIPPNGFLVISPDDDEALNNFLEGKIGWVTVQSSNPYISTYYFSDTESGACGGDHGY